LKILLDENLPRQLARDLVGHEVATVSGMGRQGAKNGVLLRLAAPHFDVLLTADRSLRYQQNVTIAGLAVVVLAVANTKLETIRPLLPELSELLTRAPAPGSVEVVGNWRRD
jgi:predicted nuclease of predicted toxin-antitoxin system